MIPYAFWCSKCKVRHAGECPTAIATTLGGGGLITAHDWERLPVIDLYIPYRCLKCKATKSITLVASLVASLGPNDPKILLPVGPCP